MRKYPIYLQDDEVSCGVYCIKMILKYYDIDEDTLNIKRKARIDHTGTTIKGLVETLKSYAIEAKAYHASLKDINQDSLKKHIILVEEHESFIPGSIKEVLNCEDEERILHVLLSLTGERLIELGDSPITSQGLPLSLGEQQILSLARALLCDGDIYILDEALSHLSFERKEIIIQTLFETYQEKLFMVISHDKKIMNMGYDYVIMEKGKIIEKG